MTRQLTSKEQAIRYFLGTLSEDEQSATEERFFADEAYSRFLDSVEEHLIDDYVSGKLGFEQTRDFKSKYLISQRRGEKVRAAQILQIEKLAEKERLGFEILPNPSLRERLGNLFRFPPAAGAAGGLASLVFLILLAGLLRLTTNLPPESTQTAKIESRHQMPVTERANQFLSLAAPPKEILQMPDANKKPTAENSILRPVTKPVSEKRPVTSPGKPKSNSLRPSVLPGEMAEQSHGKSLIVERGDTKNIRLRVRHSDAQEFVSYRVEIRAADGDLLWSREIAADRKTLQKPLALAVRRGALVGSSNYGLTISGATEDGQLEEINFYNFTLEKKYRGTFSPLLPVKAERKN